MMSSDVTFLPHVNPASSEKHGPSSSMSIFMDNSGPDTSVTSLVICGTVNIKSVERSFLRI